ncbi:MAG: SURF1 family protein [Hydrogenophaga sp.]
MSAWRANPHIWLVTAAAIVVMGVTAALGLWQLGRASQKQRLQGHIAAQALAAPLSAEELLGMPEQTAALHRPVRLRGHWLAGTELFLDNRPMGGRTGFVVLTALRLTNSERAVLVQRGWVPRDFRVRDRLPLLSTPAGEVEVGGRLAPPPSTLFELGSGAAGPIRQNVSLAALAAEWRIPLLDGVSVLQTDTDASGMARHWPVFVGDEHKHLAYAAQWFALCAITAGLYLWFQILSPRSKRRPHGQHPR